MRITDFDVPYAETARSTVRRVVRRGFRSGRRPDQYSELDTSSVLKVDTAWFWGRAGCRAPRTNGQYLRRGYRTLSLRVSLRSHGEVDLVFLQRLPVLFSIGIGNGLAAPELVQWCPRRLRGG